MWAGIFTLNAIHRPAPLIVGIPAILLFGGILTILLAGLLGFFNQPLSKIIVQIQNTLFLIFQIFFAAFWIDLWFVYGEYDRPIELIALGETGFSFLPLYIVSHFIERNPIPKDWKKGVLLDLFMTYCEFFIVLYDINLSFSNSMQSFLLTGVIMLVVSDLSLLHLPKSGKEIDICFHFVGEVIATLGCIGVIYQYSMLYSPLIFVFIFIFILIQYYFINFLQRLLKIYAPIKVPELISKRKKLFRVLNVIFRFQNGEQK